MTARFAFWLKSGGVYDADRHVPDPDESMAQRYALNRNDWGRAVLLERNRYHPVVTKRASSVLLLDGND